MLTQAQVVAHLRILGKRANGFTQQRRGAGEIRALIGNQPQRARDGCVLGKRFARLDRVIIRFGGIV
jgi:hypothetical protein